MKKLMIIAIASASLSLSACTGNNKTDRASDTSAAKGSGGPADSTVNSPSPSATTPGSSDTSNIGKSAAEPMGDTVKKKN